MTLAWIIFDRVGIIFSKVISPANDLSQLWISLDYACHFREMTFEDLSLVARNTANVSKYKSHVLIIAGEATLGLKS